MKKIVSLLLVICMLACLSACGGEKEEEITLSDTLSLKLEKVWATYLEAENALQSAVIWAADYVIAYCDAPCRDSYVRAVAATSAAAELAEKLAVGECTLTDEDYAEILDCGSDLSYIASDYSSFGKSAETTSLVLRTMSLDLLTESFWEYGTEYMRKNAELYKKLAGAEINIAVNKTNEIMFLSGKESYSAVFSEKAPLIINSDTPFLKQQDEIDEASDRYIDEYEKAINAFSEIESIQKANISLFEKAVQSGDYSEIFSEGIIWDEIYAVLNLPGFTMQKASAAYLDASGKECAINPGDDLGGVRPIISVQFSDADKESFLDYMLSIPINSENYSVAGSLEGETDCYISYNDGVICFDALWKSSVLTVTVYDGVSVLCPIWYVYYKLT